MYTGGYKNPEFFSLQETSTSVKINSIIEAIIKGNNAIKAHQHTSGDDGQVLITNSYTDDSVTLTKLNSALKTGTGQDYYLFPKGIIAMWAGTLATIPSGWALCDGTNGTPNLIDKFIKSVSTVATNPGTTGGAHIYTLTTDQLPSHYHSGNTSTDGYHSHSVTAGSYNDSPRFGGDNSNFQRFINASIGTSGAGSHYHSFTTSSVGSGASIDNRPAFYELAFIMKL